MKVVKIGRKWAIEGEGEGWIFNRTFPTKWKAEVASKVFKEGGRVSDYWKRAREKAPPKRKPWRVREKLEKALIEIELLDPSCEEIEEYGENAGYGVVTVTENKDYFFPHLHDTWGEKYGGRVHIDIGCGGYHLMLDKYSAEDFIEFIKNKRKVRPRNST